MDADTTNIEAAIADLEALDTFDVVARAVLGDDIAVDCDAGESLQTAIDVAPLGNVKLVVTGT